MSDVCLTIHSNKLLSGATVTWSDIVNGGSPLY